MFRLYTQTFSKTSLCNLYPHKIETWDAFNEELRNLLLGVLRMKAATQVFKICETMELFYTDLF